MARLADYDGRSTEVLEAIRAEGLPPERRLDEVLGLIDSDVETVSDGATWLLRAWLEDGCSLDPDRVTDLAHRLAGVRSHWARLHLAQSMAYLRIPDGVAESFATFLRADLASERPFLRAWAMDGLVRLASGHARFEEEAEGALKAAFEDAAASVRARARRVAAER